MYMYYSLPQFIDNVLGILHVADFSEHLQLLHLHIGRVIVPGQRTHVCLSIDMMHTEGRLHTCRRNFGSCCSTCQAVWPAVTGNVEGKCRSPLRSPNQALSAEELRRIKKKMSMKYNCTCTCACKISFPNDPTRMQLMHPN